MMTGGVQPGHCGTPMVAIEVEEVNAPLAWWCSVCAGEFEPREVAEAILQQARGDAELAARPEPEAQTRPRFLRRAARALQREWS